MTRSAVPLLLLLALAASPLAAQEKEFPTDFTEETSPSSGSMLLLVRPPFATGDERKVTVGNLLEGRLTAADIDDPVEFGSLLWDPATQSELDTHDGTTGAHLPAGISWGATVDCPGTNGGALTIAGNQIVCSDDDGGGGGGLLGSGTVDTYPVWTATDTLGDGWLSHTGADLDINLPSAGGIEFRTPDGTHPEFLRFSESGDNAIVNSPWGKTTFQVLGASSFEVHFSGPQAVKQFTAQAGVHVAGGTFRPPSSDTLPTCDSSAAGAIHFDSTSPGAWCGCTGTAPWVLLGGSGTCN